MASIVVTALVYNNLLLILKNVIIIVFKMSVSISFITLSSLGINVALYRLEVLRVHQ